MNKNSEEKSFQLPTQSRWSHTWLKPNFDFLYSDHFNGKHFFNIEKQKFEPKPKDFWKWWLTRKFKTWQFDQAKEQREFLRYAHILPQQRPDASLDDWQIWFVGHATILIQIGRYNFLTDPVWCDYASPCSGMGLKRSIAAGIALEDLPPIDAVLISHNHYDHMDLATLEWLYQKFAMPIYTGLGNGWYLPKKYEVIEMDWWQKEEFEHVKIVYTPAQHNSGRGLRDQNTALWGGFSLLTAKDHCFFAGDTGYSAHFKAIKKRLGAPRIALLPIGAYEPRYLMQHLHMNPEEAFHAHQDLQAKCSVAIHYRTFQLTEEARDQPEQDLYQVLKHSSKLLNPFYCLREGRKLIV